MISYCEPMQIDRVRSKLKRRRPIASKAVVDGFEQRSRRLSAPCTGAQRRTWNAGQSIACSGTDYRAQIRSSGEQLQCKAMRSARGGARRWSWLRQNPALTPDGAARVRQGCRRTTQNPRLMHRTARRLRPSLEDQPGEASPDRRHATTCWRCAPSLSIASSITSPAFRKIASGFLPSPTPGGVPVMSRSPGYSVTYSLT